MHVSLTSLLLRGDNYAIVFKYGMLERISEVVMDASDFENV